MFARAPAFALILLTASPAADEAPRTHAPDELRLHRDAITTLTRFEPGDRFVALRIRAESTFDTERVELQDMRFLVAGTADNKAHLVDVRLWHDANRNGAVDPGDRALSRHSPSWDNLPFALDAGRFLLGSGESASFLVELATSADCQRGDSFAVTSFRFHEWLARDPDAGHRVVPRLAAGRMQGPAFNCQAPPQLDGDANGDGRIDAIDIQRVARGLGRDLPDPDGNGVVNARDAAILVDAFLGRPTITRAPRNARQKTLITLQGFDLADGPVSATLYWFGQRIVIILPLDLHLHTAHECVFALRSKYGDVAPASFDLVVKVGDVTVYEGGLHITP